VSREISLHRVTSQN